MIVKSEHLCRPVLGSRRCRLDAHGTLKNERIRWGRCASELGQSVGMPSGSEGCCTAARITFHFRLTCPSYHGLSQDLLARPRARGYLPDSPKPASSTEMTGSPRFLEDPTMNVPCSPTPAGPPRSATAALWCCLPPRKTRFRMAGQPFRAGLITRWVPAKGFRSSHPPFPSFTWRTHFTVSKSSGSPTIEFGNARLRKALWMVVLNAVRCNPWLRQYYENVFGPRANLARSPSSQLCESCSRRSGAWPLTGDPSFHT